MIQEVSLFIKHHFLEVHHPPEAKRLILRVLHGQKKMFFILDGDQFWFVVDRIYIMKMSVDIDVILPEILDRDVGQEDAFPVDVQKDRFADYVKPVG